MASRIKKLEPKSDLYMFGFTWVVVTKETEEITAAFTSWVDALEFVNRRKVGSDPCYCFCLSLSSS
jgi:hypothetical protein